MTEDERLISDCSVVQQSTGQTGVVTRRIARETIVIPVSSRVGDLDAIYTFNEVASRIWLLLEQPLPIKTIAAVLSDEYEAPPEQVLADVLELLASLRDKRLVRVTETSEA
jgi:hypothetical protein